MISKKSRKVVAALLIGATVCASGTFAYFNSTVDMNAITENGAMKKLNITNGYIRVTGEFTSAKAKVSGWTYDVARVSSGVYSSTNKTGVRTDIDGGNVDLSPDITGFQKTGSYSLADTVTTGSTLTRLAIGAPLSATDPTITAARPGDAIMLGDASSTNEEDKGLKIVNSTNLTCKAQVLFDTTGNAAQQLKAMGDAGWVMYVGDSTTPISLSQLTDIEGSAADGSDDVKSALTEINEYLKTVADTIVVKPGDSAVIKIRFELPTLRDNDYQAKSNATDPNTAFDLSGILDIVVTQENNPGWNNDGSETRPYTSGTNNGGIDADGNPSDPVTH